MKRITKTIHEMQTNEGLGTQGVQRDCEHRMNNMGKQKHRTHMKRTNKVTTSKRETKVWIDGTNEQMKHSWMGKNDKGRKWKAKPDARGENFKMKKKYLNQKLKSCCFARQWENTPKWKLTTIKPLCHLDFRWIYLQMLNCQPNCLFWKHPQCFLQLKSFMQSISYVQGTQSILSRLGNKTWPWLKIS